jgi:hypothetical protein
MQETRNSLPRPRCFFARIRKPIAEEFFLKHAAGLPHCSSEPVQEEILDWVYPSYDVDVRKLLSREGRKLKTYRRKTRDLIGQDIAVLRPKNFLPGALIKVVREVNKGWIRTKQARHRATEALSNTPPSPRDLMGCYRPWQGSTAIPLWPWMV